MSILYANLPIDVLSEDYMFMLFYVSTFPVVMIVVILGV